jgi:peptidoglycan/LPS O-acetylase OafA/YrhL
MRSGGAQQGGRRETVPAFLFGCLALAAALWLAFRDGSLSDQQFEILRIVLALAGGGIGAVVPGFLDLRLKTGAALALRAGGALAVFIVVYFWSPAHWQPSGAGSVGQHTGGVNSPAQNGTGNVVIINRTPRE